MYALILIFFRSYAFISKFGTCFCPILYSSPISCFCGYAVPCSALPEIMATLPVDPPTSVPNTHQTSKLKTSLLGGCAILSDQYSWVSIILSRLPYSTDSYFHPSVFVFHDKVTNMKKYSRKSASSIPEFQNVKSFKRGQYWSQLLPIPHICHLFYTHIFFVQKILYSKVREFTTKKASRQNSINLRPITLQQNIVNYNHREQINWFFFQLCVKLHTECKSTHWV